MNNTAEKLFKANQQRIKQKTDKTLMHTYCESNTKYYYDSALTVFAGYTYSQVPCTQVNHNYGFINYNSGKFFVDNKDMRVVVL